MKVPDWWTKADDEYLLDMFGHAAVSDIAGELGVDRQFVRDRAVWLRDRRENRRTRRPEAEDA